MNKKLLSVLILATLFAGQAVKPGNFGQWSSKLYNSNMYNNPIIYGVRNTFANMMYTINKQKIDKSFLEDVKKIIPQIKPGASARDYRYELTKVRNDGLSDIRLKVFLERIEEADRNQINNTPKKIVMHKTIFPVNGPIYAKILSPYTEEFLAEIKKNNFVNEFPEE